MKNVYMLFRGYNYINLSGLVVKKLVLLANYVTLNTNFKDHQQQFFTLP
ncbi:hypothetical protein [Sutcliffiella rhizosphaerae]|nr:hypothetical protein [Sutcliffiella rhizosphaerae]